MLRGQKVVSQARMTIYIPKTLVVHERAVGGHAWTCLYLRCISLLTSAVEQEQVTVRPGEMGAGNAVIPKLMASTPTWCLLSMRR